MDDLKTNQAVQSAVETDTTQVNSPATEVSTTEIQTTEGEAVQQQAPDIEASMTPEARKAFQEQRIKIKQLEEERIARQSNESAFSVFRPQPQIEPHVSQYTDPYTGETNWTAYNQAQAQQIKAEASQAAEDRIDEYEARQKFPELFADRSVEKLIANNWLGYKMEGKNISVSQVAQEVSKLLGRTVSKAEKSGAEKALEQVTSKEQASLSASGQTGSRQQISSDESRGLIEATRKGSEDAIAARMSRVPWANK